jgi:hypothetical protein
MNGLWEKANEISEVGYKVHSAAMIVELVAEKISTDVESGALWAASELLTQLSERLEFLSDDIMSINRQYEAKETKPKGKKK